VIDSQSDLIIGQPDIFQFDLAYKLPSLFSKKWSDDQLIEQQDEDQTIMQAMCGLTCVDCKHSRVMTNPWSPKRLLDRIEHDWDMIDESHRPWEAT
jgi:hypothetical protein